MVQNIILNTTIGELIRGRKLTQSIPEEIYLRANIGLHFRHNLNFVEIFVTGLPDRKIDYNNRIRDERIEREPKFAIEKMGNLIRELSKLEHIALGFELSVRSEIDEEVWHASNAMRELDFLHSHLVHHHALVAEKLNNLGFELTSEFGVAPSTLKYWATRNG